VRQVRQERTKPLKVILSVLLPLTALALLGVSSFLWYKVLKPEPLKVSKYLPIHISADDFSKKLENTLLMVLSENGIDTTRVKIRDASATQKNINKIYTVEIPGNISLTLLNYRIAKMAREMGGQIFQGIEDIDGKTLTLKIGTLSRPTDMLVFRKTPDIRPSLAKMAIIVDDLGIREISLAQRLCNLEQTVTLAILPFQSYTSEVVELARKTETSYILHMPMEPKSSKENPGKGAIKVSDIESEIRQKLSKAFKNVRGAQGLNNHMGSKATEDMRTMEILMNYLKENNYFFIDSQTSRKSEAYSLAQKMGVKCSLLTGFVDIEDKPQFIRKRLDTLAEMAFKNGLVVTICHDRPNTVDVLEQKLPELEKKGIKFIRIEDVIH